MALASKRTLRYYMANSVIIVVLVIAAMIFVTSFFMMLQTVIRKELFTKKEHAHARELVKQYGQNPVSYLTLEDDKALYFGKDIPGVISYGVVGGTVVVCGDPICASDDFVSLLAEF